MADREPFSSEELAAIELGYALKNLGPDTDRVAMVTIRLANGRYIEDVWLSKKDLENLVDASIAISERQSLAEAADPLPLDDEVTAETVTDVVRGFERLLSDGGE